ncbi:MAG: elongation factor P maturation arginine rhamnosyltransferase EarP, partial [Nitrosomonadaceae bacterium]
MKLRWDIFCTIVDNFGDVGFCWRLARQLVNEHGLEVRLWVDDLAIFSQIAPAIDVDEERQWLQGVEIYYWQQPFARIKPADVVIETFACKLPDNYILAMADLPQQPVWINLEYLSAENWTLDCHCLPSFHPHLSLTKYFFFPGFVEGTGGLLLEKNLLPARNGFNNVSQEVFWQETGIQSRREGE